MGEGTQGTCRAYLRSQSEPEFPSREYRFMYVRALGTSSKRSHLLAVFSTVPHRAFYFIYFWMVVFFLHVDLQSLHNKLYLVIICIL